MVEELKVKLTADVESFKKGMKQAQDALEETTDKGEEAESSFERMANTMESISPTFKAAADKWRQSSEKLGATFSKNGKLAKGFKLAGLVAIGGVVAAVLKEVVGAITEAAKKVWQFAKDTAKMYDPQGFSKSAGAVDKSMRKLKTAVGSFTAPIVNAVQSVFSKIIDGVTWIIEKVRVGIAYITGIVKAVFEPVVNGIRSVVSWVQGAINVLGNFLGMGDIFKTASESAQDTADSMGEVVEATSAGLASFDKLTTLNFGDMGDAEEAEKISDAISEADKDGQELVKGMNKWLKDMDLGQVWTDFVQGCIDIKDKIVEAVTGWFDGAKKWASDTWDKFVKGCGEVAGKIAMAVVNWFTNAATWASEMWGKFVTGCTDIATKIWEGVTGWFSEAATWASDMWTNFVTACGEVATKVVEAIVGWFSDAATWASDLWTNFVTGCSEVATKIVEAVLGWFSDAATWASDVWDKFVTGCSDISTRIVEAVGGWFEDAATWASDTWGEFVTACKNVSTDIVNAIVDWFGNASTWASDMWEKFTEACTNVKTDIVTEIKKWFGNASTWASDMWKKFVDGCTNVKEDISKKAGEWFTDASKWSKDTWDKFVEGCTNVKTDIVDGVVGWFKELPEKMKKIGKDLIDGLVQGINDTIGDMGSALTNGINKVIGGVKSFLGIHSPSTLMRDEIGVNIGKGITEGVLSTEDSLVNESMAMVERVTTQIRNTLDASVAQLEREYTAAVSDIVSGASGSSSGSTSSGSSGASSLPEGVVSSSSRGYIYEKTTASGEKYLYNPPDTVREYKDLLETRYVALTNDIAALQKAGDDAASAHDSDTSFALYKQANELRNALQSAASSWYSSKQMPQSITAGGKTYYASADDSEYRAKRKSELYGMYDQIKSIMGLAGGGAIAPGNPQPYILGDNNREYEVVSPVSLMEQTVISAMKKMGIVGSSQSDRPIEVSIELDGRKMARALYDPMETEKRRRGVRA